ncbi:MAG: hypothetical protein WD078_06540 [Woeseia sp.]
MFHMLSCFNLTPDVDANEFRVALDELTMHMKAADLLHSTSPIGRRQRHPVMDTDDERDHEYFFIMSFENRPQCDAAVRYMTGSKQPGNAAHESVQTMISTPVFICWQDIETDDLQEPAR